MGCDRVVMPREAYERPCRRCGHRLVLHGDALVRGPYCIAYVDEKWCGCTLQPSYEEDA